MQSTHITNGNLLKKGITDATVQYQISLGAFLPQYATFFPNFGKFILCNHENLLHADDDRKLSVDNSGTSEESWQTHWDASPGNTFRAVVSNSLQDYHDSTNNGQVSGVYIYTDPLPHNQRHCLVDLQRDDLCIMTDSGVKCLDNLELKAQQLWSQSTKLVCPISTELFKYGEEWKRLVRRLQLAVQSAQPPPQTVQDILDVLAAALADSRSNYDIALQKLQELQTRPPIPVAEHLRAAIYGQFNKSLKKCVKHSKKKNPSIKSLFKSCNRCFHS